MVGGSQVAYIWECLPEIPLTPVLEHGIAALWYLEGSMRAECYHYRRSILCILFLMGFKYTEETGYLNLVVERNVSVPDKLQDVSDDVRHDSVPLKVTLAIDTRMSNAVQE